MKLITAKNIDGDIRQFTEGVWNKLPSSSSKGAKFGWIEIEKANQGKPKEVLEAELNELNGKSRDELKEIAQAMGLKVNGRSSEETIIKQIKEANGQ